MLYMDVEDIPDLTIYAWCTIEKEQLTVKHVHAHAEIRERTFRDIYMCLFFVRLIKGLILEHCFI